MTNNNKSILLFLLFVLSTTLNLYPSSYFDVDYEISDSLVIESILFENIDETILNKYVFNTQSDSIYINSIRYSLGDSLNINFSKSNSVKIFYRALNIVRFKQLKSLEKKYKYDNPQILKNKLKLSRLVTNISLLITVPIMLYHPQEQACYNWIAAILLIFEVVLVGVLSL